MSVPLVERTIRSDASRVLAQVLRDMRVEAELTQVELASRLSEPQRLVSDVERGERRLDLLEARQYVHALGLTLRDLLDRLDNLLPPLQD